MRSVAIQTDLKWHYIDHLGVLCAIAGIPFLFTDEEQFEIAKKYYPDLNAQLVDYEDITPEKLLENYEVLFSTHCWNRELFHQVFETAFDKPGKKLFTVFCQHGNSDKGDGPDGLELLLNHDAVFLYGQHMIDFLKELNLWDQLGNKVITGNYRYSYYKQHHDFYEQRVHEEVFSHFPVKQKTLLYAPTWNPDFFTTHRHVLENLPDDMNLIVKVHHRLMQDHLGLMLRILGDYESRKNILFLTDFPPIYPLLQHVDLFIGDLSSIGYDFLAFNRPMFFLNSYAGSSNPQRNFFLWKCGVEILPSDYSRLYSIIREHVSQPHPKLEAIRKEMYTYAFGEEKPLKKLIIDFIKNITI